MKEFKLTKEQMQEYRQRYADMLSEYQVHELVDILMDYANDKDIIEFAEQMMDMEKTDNVVNTLFSLDLMKKVG